MMGTDVEGLGRGGALFPDEVEEEFEAVLFRREDRAASCLPLSTTGEGVDRKVTILTRFRVELGWVEEENVR